MRAPRPAALSLALALSSIPLGAGQPKVRAQGQFGQREPDFDRMPQQQAETDKAWRAASEGFMQMEKITYRSKVGDLDVYKDRSPLYNVDKLQIPVYVGVTRNDEDVNFEEDMQLVDALRSRKPALAETMVYDNPPGGHTFDRRVDPKTWQPENTREQRDSWNRVWTFLDWNLDPFHGAAPASTK